MRWLFSLLLFLTPLAAAPTVRAVLFYSPNCPHCHDVIDEEIAPMMAKKGDQFRVLLINIATDEGQELYHNAIEALHIPENRHGVPTMIIGSHVLVGSEEIPAALPLLFEQGIKAGGVAWPHIPGLTQGMAKPEPEVMTTNLQEVVHPTLAQLLKRDPVGNSIAIAVFIGIVFSAIFVGYSWVRHGLPHIWGSSTSWTAPLLAIVGLGIAIYLSYLEITGDPAFCGPVGDCNAVQQSRWAQIFGLPVGVVGAVGYLIIAFLWIWQRYSPLASQTYWILPLFTLTGVLFSAYLTFLEPFIIGAVCAWCLLSAIILTLLLWMTTSRRAIA